MEAMTLDLFGQQQSTEPLPLRNRSGSFNINPCIAVLGKGPDGEKCKNCKHLISKKYAKTYYKCALRGTSNSTSTDHRVNWPACGKFDRIDVNGGPVTDPGYLEQIKQQLEAGRRITVQSVLRSVGTQELRHYIPIIRRTYQLNISSQWLNKNGKRFKEYFLLPPAA